MAQLNISSTVPTVKISSYGRYSSDNYGLNTMEVKIGSLTLYYSYETIVAFRDYDLGLVVSTNIWSTTTGKHLSWIDGGNKKNRLDHNDFVEKLNETLKKHIN